MSLFSLECTLWGAWVLSLSSFLFCVSFLCDNLKKQRKEKKPLVNKKIGKDIINIYWYHIKKQRVGIPERGKQRRKRYRQRNSKGMKQRKLRNIYHLPRSLFFYFLCFRYMEFPKKDTIVLFFLSFCSKDGIIIDVILFSRIRITKYPNLNMCVGGGKKSRLK